MIKRLATLYETAKHRPAGYAEEVLSKSTIRGEYYDVPADWWEAMRKKYRPEQPHRRQLVPTPEEQAAWLARVRPICQGCTAFKGVQETPTMKIVRRVGCEKCRTCGSSTVGPMDACPLGKW